MKTLTTREENSICCRDLELLMPLASSPNRETATKRFLVVINMSRAKPKVLVFEIKNP
jgi:hypothetical protein